MNTQAKKSRYLPLLITGIAVILFSSAGVARMMGWGPNSTDGSGDVLAPDNLPRDSLSVASAKPVALTAQTGPGQGAGEARARVRCAECGVIVSMREFDAREEGAGLDTAGLDTAGLDTAGLNTSGGTAARNQDELRVTTARRYEMTIRLADGSSRVISHASPASWRSGERVIVIDGANPPNR